MGAVAGVGFEVVSVPIETTGTRLPVDEWRRFPSNDEPDPRSPATRCLTQWSPRTRYPRSQANGQMRDVIDRITLSALRFATRTSSFVPACLLKASRARREAAFQSP